MTRSIKSLSYLSLFLFASFLIIPQNVSSSQVELVFVGDDIKSEIYVGSSFIFEKSDTLILNNSVLQRDIDYKFIPLLKSFKLLLSKFESTDSLVVKYETAPTWLKLTYGNKLDKKNIGNSTQRRIKPKYNSLASGKSSSNNINLFGTKTFRFTNRSQGNSTFGQSLNLKLDGNITESMTIRGSVSDKGYSPSYGTASSRVNEFDKVNLQVESPSFRASIGNINYVNNLYSKPLDKNLSGVSLSYSSRYSEFSVIAARPKGSYKSTDLIGVDNNQGPYLVELGSLNAAIVSGSESIWLDGKLLERGVNNDYNIDYSLGEITFNLNNQINSRSRIRIEYELLSTDYRGEYLNLTNSYTFLDSSLAVSLQWVREGDDKDNPILGELSNADRQILENAGDDSLLAIKSGVLLDSLGSYILVVDSLPDSVFQYVGDSLGDYTINFSFVGTSKGRYIFLGNNNYLFVGSGNGDYRPQTELAIPKRIDVYRAWVNYKNNITGELQTSYAQSVVDRNLFSNSNVSSQSGNSYKIKNEKKWDGSKFSGFLNLSLSRSDKSFSDRAREQNPDLLYKYNFNSFITPNADESLDEIKLSTTFYNNWAIALSRSELDYDSLFKSKFSSMTATYDNKKKISLSTLVENIDSKFENDSLGTGSAEKIFSKGKYKFSAKKYLALEIEQKERTYKRLAGESGSKQERIKGTLSYNSEAIEIEFQNDDTIFLNSEIRKKRTRFSLLSERRVGKLYLYSTIATQKIEQENITDNSLLARSRYNFNSPKHSLSFSGHFNLTSETRNAKGIKYLEVTRGEGNFIFEDGQYIPDLYGNFIKVDELLSTKEKVKQGEKGFRLSKKWKSAKLNYNFKVKEELLESGTRDALWIIPFYSDASQSYLFYSRTNNLDIKLFPVATSYFLNISFLEDIENRLIASQNVNRKDFESNISLNEISGKLFFSQTIKLFENNLDSYFGSGGKVDGFAIAAELKILSGSNQYKLKSEYRKAENNSNSKSEIVKLIFEQVIRKKSKGSIRYSIEGYSQKLTGPAVISYKLTDNRPGSKGVIWNISTNYKLDKTFKVNININGRHSDSRRAVVFARGEFVASF